MADLPRYRGHRIPHGLTAAGVIRQPGLVSLPPDAAAHDRALGPGSRAPPASRRPGAPRGQPLHTSAAPLPLPG
jgi:hypothetical protein